MTSTNEISEKIAEILHPILDSMKIEPVDIEYRREGGRMILRVLLDKDGGITLDDCASVSRELSTILDVNDIIDGKYTLEVSSPGVDRPLKKQADFLRYKGEDAKIKTASLVSDSQGNRRKTFRGTISDVTSDSVKITLTEGQEAVIPITEILKANLEYKF